MKKTNKSKVALLLACTIMATVGILIQTKRSTAAVQDVTLAQVSAFTQSESNTEQSNGSATPPDPWNYLRGRYLKIESVTEVVKSGLDGSLSFSRGKISGYVGVHIEYSVHYMLKDCLGEQEDAWCDQRLISYEIVSVERYS